MPTLLESIARHGFRGTFHTLRSPQNSIHDRPNQSPPRYVCARRKYTNGNKGRTSVYRVVQHDTDRHGRKMKLYVNVEDRDPEEGERDSFIGIKGGRARGRLGSVRAKNDEEVRLAKKETRGRQDDPNRQGEHIKNHTRTQNTSSRSRKEREHTTSLRTWRQRFQELKSQGKKQTHESSSDTTSAVQRENSHVSKPAKRKDNLLTHDPKPLCSDALPNPQTQSHRQRKGPTSTIRTVSDAESLAVSDNSPGSPFKQPSMTAQASTALVFGAKPSRRRVEHRDKSERVTEEQDVHGDEPVEQDYTSTSHVPSPSHSNNENPLQSKIARTSPRDSKAQKSVSGLTSNGTAVMSGGTLAHQAGLFGTMSGVGGFKGVDVPGTPPYTPDKSKGKGVYLGGWVGGK